MWPEFDPSYTQLRLVTLAGTEHTMPVCLDRYENLVQLEEDILSFLSTASGIDVFGCTADLIDPDTQLPLNEAFRSVLFQDKQVQVVVRSCLEVGHTIWQFQEEGRDLCCPKAVHVPCNPRGAVEDRAFFAAPKLRHAEVADGVRHIGFAAWQGCHRLQIVRLPPSVVCLGEGAFQSCYLLREITAPGCIRFNRKVFAECIALSQIGPCRKADGANILAPGAQLGCFAFEHCSALKTLTFETDRTRKDHNMSYSLPEGSLRGTGIGSLNLPCDYHSIGAMACENCTWLIEVNLQSTVVTELPASVFAHCVAMTCILLPPRLKQIGYEAFGWCIALKEVRIPAELQYIGNRAYWGCKLLRCLTTSGSADASRLVQAEHNAFGSCDNFEKAPWIELLPSEELDSDALDEEIHTEPGEPDFDW